MAESGWTERSATTTSAPTNPPFAPVSVSAEDQGSFAMLVSWARAAGSPLETSFEVQVSTTGAGGSFTTITTTGANTFNYVHSGLNPFTQYWYRVRGTNGDGSSPWSAVATDVTDALPTPDPTTPSTLVVDPLFRDAAVFVHASGYSGSGDLPDLIGDSDKDATITGADFAEHKGQSYLWFDGESGNVLSKDFTWPTTSSNLFWVEWIAKVSAEDWTPTTAKGIMGGEATRSYFQVNSSTGYLQAGIYDGSSHQTVTSTTNPSFTDGRENVYWVRAVWNVDTDEGFFYTSTEDHLNDWRDVTWTALGSTATASADPRPTAANARISIGSTNQIGTTVMWDGNIYAATVLVNGVPAAEFYGHNLLPDNASLDVGAGGDYAYATVGTMPTTAFDFQILVRAEDWDSTNHDYLVSLGQNTSNHRVFGLGFINDEFYYWLSSSGTGWGDNSQPIGSGYLADWPDDYIRWVRCTWDGSDIKLYFAPYNGTTDLPTTWSFVAEDTGTAVSTLHQYDRLNIATDPSLAVAATTQTLRVAASWTIGGTPVFDVDFTKTRPGEDTSLTASTGQTVTLAGNALVWADGAQKVDDFTGGFYDGTGGNDSVYLTDDDFDISDLDEDIDIRAHISSTNYLKGSGNETCVVGLYNGGGPSLRAFWFGYDDVGHNIAFFTSDGSTDYWDASDTVSGMFEDGRPMWIRATYDKSDKRYYYSYDHTNDPHAVTWTAAGSDARTHTINNLTDSLSIGHTESGAAGPSNDGWMDGEVYRVWIGKLSDGETHYDHDFTKVPRRATGSIDNTGKTGSLSGSAEFGGGSGTWTIIKSTTSGTNSMSLVAAPLFSMDATDDEIVIPDHDDLDAGESDSMTVVMAFRSNILGTTTESLWGKVARVAAGNPGYWAYTDAGLDDPLGGWNDDDGDRAYDIAARPDHGDPIDDTYRTVANRLDRDNDEVEIFIDAVGTGTPTDSTSVGDTTNSEDIKIGRAGLNSRFHGEFIGFGVWRYALTDDQVTYVHDRMNTMGALHPDTVQDATGAWLAEWYNPNDPGKLPSLSPSRRYGEVHDVAPGFLTFDGTGGNYFGKTITSPTDTSSDWEVVTKVTMTDWTPSTVSAVTGANSSRWHLDVLTDGKLRYRIETASASNNDSTVALPSLVADEVYWLRVVHNMTSGDVDFYYSNSDDDVQDPRNVTWTQLGATVSGDTGGLNASVTEIVVGQVNTGSTQPMDGNLYYTHWSIDGNIVHRFDVQDDQYADDALGQDYSSWHTGTWTSTGTDWSYTPPAWTLATADKSYTDGGNPHFLFVAPDIAWLELQDGSVFTEINDLRICADLDTWTPEGYLHLDGFSGNYASLPDSDDVSVTGDIDIRVDVVVDDWTPSSEQALLAKQEVVNTTKSSYRINLETNGRIKLMVCDGTSFFQPISTTDPGLTDGDRAQIRVTLDLDDGGGNYVTDYYYRTDGDIEASTGWTAIGTTVTTAGAISSINDSDSPVEFGSRELGTVTRLAGKVYRAQVYDGIDGTLVLDANFISQKFGTTTFRESANEALVTVNGAASIRDGAIVFSDDPGSATRIMEITGDGRIRFQYTNTTGGLSTFLSSPYDHTSGIGWVRVKMSRATVSGISTWTASFYEGGDDPNNPAWSFLNSVTGGTGPDESALNYYAFGIANGFTDSSSTLGGKIYRITLYSGGTLVYDIDPSDPPSGSSNIVYQRPTGTKSLILVDRTGFAMDRTTGIRIPDPWLNYPIVRSDSDTSAGSTFMLLFRYDSIPDAKHDILTKEYDYTRGFEMSLDTILTLVFDNSSDDITVDSDPNQLTCVFVRAYPGSTSTKTDVEVWVNGVPSNTNTVNSVVNPDRVYGVPWEFTPGSQIEFYGFAYWNRKLTPEEIGTKSALLTGGTTYDVYRNLYHDVY